RQQQPRQQQPPRPLPPNARAETSTWRARGRSHLAATGTTRRSRTSLGQDQLAGGSDAQPVVLTAVLQDGLPLAVQELGHLATARLPGRARRRRLDLLPIVSPGCQGSPSQVRQLPEYGARVRAYC